MFSFGHCPNEGGGRALPELKNTLYIFLYDGRKRCTSCPKEGEGGGGERRGEGREAEGQEGGAEGAEGESIERALPHIINMGFSEAGVCPRACVRACVRAVCEGR